jgi:putative ABC transport system ATP-binding protein
MSFIVNCQSVSKTYGEGSLEVHAVRDLNLNVSKGEFLSLSGPSGSGKTTLLNLIGGLDKATNGEIIVDGQHIEHMGKGQLADLRLNHIGFVFQAYNLIPVLSAYENVEFIMQLQGVSGQERRQRAQEILSEVGLQGLGDRRPAQLSGGQQQRVAVARAIVSRPAIVLADEPTANLDSHTSDELLATMQQLNEKYNVTFIVATHDPKVIEFTKRRIKMRDGEIQQDESIT